MCVSQVGRVTTVAASSGTVAVDVEGLTHRVSVAPIVLDGRAVHAGDWLLIHSGLAVDVLDERTALEVSEFIRSRTEERS